MTCCENKKRIADYDDWDDFADVPKKKAANPKEICSFQFRLFEIKIYHRRLGRKVPEPYYRLLLSKQPIRRGDDTGD